MNIFVLNKGGSKTGILSNQGANPPAPFFDDLYTQELETGADTYYFSTISNSYTQDLLYVGNKVMFEFGNKQKLFTIASIEYEHKDGQKIIGVYAEGIGFELLDIFMHKPKIQSSGSSSGSGSGSGNDSDGDGDDHLDDEYGDPDDVWIDEDGNIVYIKNNKENGSDYGSPDDVWIDEDGNICYKKNKSKNRDNSSLKLTNISYTKFLNLILKNTGWTYVVDPELDRNKQDMEIRYDTNIYAILQDSMQTYQGVELEFIYEYNNGNIRKVVKAYRNGGRGSITGKRLQYGVNIRGITKMQEIADEKEENIIYDESVSTVNGYRVQLTYDVDIALKSLDVHDMRIGDTYTVIDHEFRPAMQFNARIGKIEISFSDMTRNKCYLANFKKIKGAVSEDEENNPIDDIIKNAIEDYLEDDDDIVDDGTGDGGTGGIVAEDHEHGAIAYDKTNTKIGAHWENYMYIDREAAGVSFDGENAFIFNRNGSLDVMHRSDTVPVPPTPPNSAGPIESSTTDQSSWTEGDVHRAPAGQIPRDPRHGYDSTSYDKTSIWGTGVHTPATDAFSHRVYCSKKDVLRDTCKEIPSDSSYTDPNLWSKANKKDMVNFIKELCIFETVHGMLSPTFDYNLSGFDTGALITDRHNGLYKMVYKEAPNVIGLFTEHEEGSGLNQVSPDYTFSYDLGSLLMTQIGAFQSHLESHSGAGSDGIYATIEYADYIKGIANSAASKATTATETAKSASNNVEVYSSLVNELKSAIKGWRTNENMINGEMIYQYTIGKEALKHNILTADHVQKKGSDLPDNQILVTNDLSDSVTDNISNKPASRAAVKKAYDKAVEALNASNGGGGSGSGSSGSNDNCTVCSHMSYNELTNAQEENMGLKYLEVLDKTLYVGRSWYDSDAFDFTGEVNPDYTGYRSAFMCNGVADMTNIRCHYIIRTPMLKARHIVLEDEDYYYDGDDVGDPSISGHLAEFTNITCEKINGYNINDLFSSISQANTVSIDEQQETISELQATVQQQQETIATLEARLARLEQHLGLSDDI